MNNKETLQDYIVNCDVVIKAKTAAEAIDAVEELLHDISQWDENLMAWATGPTAIKR